MKIYIALFSKLNLNICLYIQVFIRELKNIVSNSHVIRYAKTVETFITWQIVIYEHVKQIVNTFAYVYLCIA